MTPLPGAAEVAVRTGDAAGDRSVVVRPRTAAPAAVPPAPVTAHVAGHAFRVSPGSFFQPSSHAAEALGATVLALAGPVAGASVLDLYAGVGVLSAPLAAAGALVVAVESAPAAVRDARTNLRDLDVAVRGVGVEDALEGPPHADVVVLDPPRAGAGPAVCAAVAALEPTRIVYVSCHPGAMARDLTDLRRNGYVAERLVPLDQFAQTAHLEVVAALVRK